MSLRKSNEDFDWSEISPTIFNLVFESTLNPEAQRSGGMHYTSIGTIHILIDPLFLDGLRTESAESPMMKVTEDVLHMSLDFLPLKSYASITEGNIVRLDWGSVLPKCGLNYIVGDPPFVGFTLVSAAQKEDM